jgi:hypothetical protein
VEPDGRVTLVRDLWEAWRREGVEAMLAIAGDGVDWAPHARAGEVFHGTDELRAYWAENAARGERHEATVYATETIGDAVVMTGSLRVMCAGRLTESQIAWAFVFDGDRLRSATGYASRSDALRALAAYA